MRLHKILLDELEKSNLPWNVINGKKHYLIKISGKMVAIVNKGNKVTSSDPNSRALMNTRAQIRRAIKEIKDEKMDRA